MLPVNDYVAAVQRVFAAAGKKRKMAVSLELFQDRWERARALVLGLDVDLEMRVHDNKLEILYCWEEGGRAMSTDIASINTAQDKGTLRVNLSLLDELSGKKTEIKKNGRFDKIEMEEEKKEEEIEVPF